MMHRLQTIGTIEETIAPAFTLPSARDGQPVSLHTFRQRQPVGILFVPRSADAPSVLQTVGRFISDVHEAGATILMIVREPVSSIPADALQVLVDRDGRVFERYEADREDAFSLFGLDRYGAVVYQRHCRAEELESALRALLDAIRFSEIQCPE
ncbi:MAG: redoxin domain-containing protein [Chthonomonadetes bacterium]|nr:redoxin domain-containing protein [Chthonomonadetes bacterium]